MIKAVLFDYGGTLVRARRPWEEVKPEAIAASHALMCHHGLKVPYDEYATLDSSTFERYSELEKQTESDIPDVVKYEEMVGRFFPNSSKTWREKIAAQATDAFWDVATANFVLQRGARRCLAELKSKKIRLAIVSNHHSPKSLTRHLIKLGIKSYFSTITISSQVGCRKPGGRIFEMCLSIVKVEPREAVFIGDSMSWDIEGAKRAGMATILVESDGGGQVQEGPDYTVFSLAEVPRIVRSL